MTRVRKNKGLFAFLLVSMLLTAGCTSSSNNTASNDSYEKQDISGVWWGFIGTVFAVGMLTTDDNEHFYGRFIGQYHNSLAFTQFINPDGSYLTQTPDSAVFQGVLEECTWNTSGPYDYSTMPLQTLSILGSASTKRVFGGPPFCGYNYTAQPYNAEQLKFSTFVFYYNTTYDQVPNVNNLSGQWEIKDILKKGNTLVLTIINPNTADTKGADISGHDNLNNTFNGTIEIHYSDTPHNIYDVNLKLNNSIDLTGLAAYVLEGHTGGVFVSKKTLAIGATNTDKSYSLSGLAEFIK